MINLFNKLQDKLNNDNKIKVIITWRSIFYFSYLAILFMLVSIALNAHYENRLFMIAVWFMFVCSYPLSMFFIKIE